MSIYATQWTIKLPHGGDDYPGCKWVEVTAQGVPAHIGSPTPGAGYEDGDPYVEFLPPAIEYRERIDDGKLRAVVFISEATEKGTPRSGQEYVSPLLVLNGEEYEKMPARELIERLCDALRGDRPRCTIQFYQPDGRVKLFFEDGSEKIVNYPTDPNEPSPN